MAAESARLAWERGAKVIVLPPIPFGVNTTQLDLRLCVNMCPSTQLAVLRDVAESLAGQGISKLVILNGHGGNDFRPLIRELVARVHLLICTIDWYSVVDPRRFFAEPGDHAGELETSVMLHIAPDLVRPLTEAGKGRQHAFRLRGLRDGVAWTPRAWSKATDDTGIGDPSKSAADNGARFVDAATTRIAEFLIELAAADTEQLYE